ncbi:hypothetical protein [Mesorhizobium sp. M0514]
MPTRGYRALTGEPVAAFGKTKTVNDEMEAEVDEAAVERPAGRT